MKKRIFASILTLLLCCISISVHAEEANEASEGSYDFLDTMSLDELYELQAQILIRVAGYGVFVDDEMPQGIYIVGKDIKPGTYDLVAYSMGRNTFDAVVSPILTIYENEDAMDNYHWLDMLFFNTLGEPTRYTLEDGYVLKLEYGSIFVQQPAKKSWSMD